MDKELVDRISGALNGPYGRIELEADGHRLKAEVRCVSKCGMKYAVVLFVDGWIKGENLKVESDIGAKFYPLRTRQLLSAKAYAGYRKAFGKRAEAEYRKRTIYQYRESHFRTGRALAMHLKKTCTHVREITEAASHEA